MTTPPKPDHEKRPFRFKLEGPFLRVSTMLLITPISPNFKGLKCSVFGRFRALQSRKIYGTIYTVFLVIAVISAAPLFYIGNKWALILWCVIALAAMYFAAKVERIKKDNDVQTYKEIVAFCEGKRLDEIQSAREYGKRPYQKVLWFIGSAAVGAIVSYVLSLLLQSF